MKAVFRARSWGRGIAAKTFFRANWHLITIGVMAGAILCLAVVLLDTMPPHTIAMATGPASGGYQSIGKEYQAVLARAGEQLRLVETTGSMQNLALLRDPGSGVKAALIQDGTISKQEGAGLESLGTLFYQPLWIFLRDEVHGLTPNDLRGRKVSIGPVGSGSRALLLELFKRNGLDQQVGELLALEPEPAADALLAGQIDAAAFIAQWDSPSVRRLITDKHVELADAPRADAYIAVYPFLSKVTVPRGVGDLVQDLPRTDVTLLAPKASLVVRKDLNPAIQDLLLSAAVKIHSGVGIFQRAGRFPAAEGTDVPLSDEAVQFYKSGLPLLQSNFPFWLASLIGRLLVLLLPIVAVLYPIMRFLPALYGWVMRARIAQLYGELRFLEDEMGAGAGAAGMDLVERLDGLEKKASHLKVSIAYESMMDLLRNRIAVVRDRLKAG
jgi:TRAP transporter TAXI family solute receptor